MKKNIFLLGLSTLGLACSLSVNASSVVELSKQKSNDLNLNSLSFKSLISGTTNKRSISYANQEYDLKLLSEKTDSTGKVHTRYSQTYNDIPVWGRQVVQHKKRNGFGFSSATSNKYTGQLVTDIAHDLAGIKPAPGFTTQAALDFAKDLHLSEKKLNNKTDLIYENETSELMVYTHGKDQAKLVYKVSFFVDDEHGNIPARPNYLIDATTKKVIQSWNGLMHDRVATGPGGNEKIGKYEYGNDMPKLDVREAPRGECFFTNKKVRTVNLENGYYGAKTYHFNCYDNNNDEINGAYSPLNDAHYFGEQVFNMYQDWYDKAPLTFKLLMRVHYGNNYENAFWNGSSMTFGDGYSYFYPLVAMDVVGHEVSHGFTEQNSNLEYMGQSGGINEAFSDMAGKATEYYTFGNNTWGIGDDITRGDEPLRYMDTPEKDGMSIGDARDFTSWIDVHYSSGVFNKAFFLLATKDAWNIKKAFDVFVHANTYYWVPSSDFEDGALGAVYSAEDLGYDTEDVADVFKQVGIECSDDACKTMPKEESKSDDNSENDSDVGSDVDSDSDADSDTGSDLPEVESDTDSDAGSDSSADSDSNTV